MRASKHIPHVSFRTVNLNPCRRNTQPVQKKYRYPCTGRTNIEGFGDFIDKELGPSRRNIKEFAKELEKEFKWPRITLTNSGSSANLAASLTIAEKCKEKLGITKVNEPIHLGNVLVAGFTFPSTMASLLTAGFSLRIIDTEENGFCLDPNEIEKQITKETRAICVTHFLGFPAQMDKISEIAKKHNLYILQDACESMTLEVNGKYAHDYGDISTWSFYHPHHMSSFGGGAVSSPHPDWQILTESVTHWGRKCTCHFNPEICQAPDGMHHNFWYVRTGHNLEMSELNACFGRFQLRDWHKMENSRFKHYEILYDTLQNLPNIRVWPMVKGCSSPFVFPIKVQDNQTVKQLLGEFEQRGVEIRSLMGGAISEQPAYSHIPTGKLDNCLDMSQTAFFVGVHQTLKEEDVKETAKILKDVLD